MCFVLPNINKCAVLDNDAIQNLLYFWITILIIMSLSVTVRVLMKVLVRLIVSLKEVGNQEEMTQIHLQ